jgi:hypothetical protein
MEGINRFTLRFNNEELNKSYEKKKLNIDVKIKLL